MAAKFLDIFIRIYQLTLCPGTCQYLIILCVFLNNWFVIIIK